MERTVILTRAMIGRFSQCRTIKCFNLECDNILKVGDRVRRLSSHGGKYFCPNGCLITEVREKALTDDEVIAILVTQDLEHTVNSRGHSVPRFSIVVNKAPKVKNRVPNKNILNKNAKRLRLANISNYY